MAEAAMSSFPNVPGVAGGLLKSPTGIRGFDEITRGGLPAGRPTLVTGASGSGKTLFALEFLVRGARDFGEPGVLLAFEESGEDLAANVASLGFDLPGLEAAGILVVDAFRVYPSDIVATGAFDLEGLFIRLASAVDEVGAKRVVLDTIEVLFSALGNEAIVRGEMSRLFRWCKDRGLTLVVTGEQGRDGSLTRYGIEEYVSDCVIALDHRVSEERSTRRLRVVKYRGAAHGTNEYPFLITEQGFQVLPATSMGLAYGAPTELMSVGVDALDRMLGGGVYRGSTLLVSGGPGTGKTTLAAQAVEAACARGEHALFISFEESADQQIRNMASVGIDLRKWVDAGLLTMWAERSTAQGLEAHLGTLQRLLDEGNPAVVVLDGTGSLMRVGDEREVTMAVAREIDMMKYRGITAILTTLTHDDPGESSSVGVSSLTDTWLLLRNIESDGERNRLLFVIKSRGMAHSNQVREFVLTDHGADLVDVYVGPDGVLTGSGRAKQLSRDQAQALRRDADVQRRRFVLAQRSAEVNAKIAVLQAQLESEAQELDAEVAQEVLSHSSQAASQTAQEQHRAAGAADSTHPDGAS
ncbi:MAG: circadian clock protein KaiC [Actinomycetes bacterium]